MDEARGEQKVWARWRKECQGAGAKSKAWPCEFLRGSQSSSRTRKKEEAPRESLQGKLGFGMEGTLIGSLPSSLLHISQLTQYILWYVEQ